ncbi:hypothetical protein AVEN_56262-1 [Araneus ventricosus]|uniref:Uncharacterized protein n=1 Tax=Araneus ventricosus TaxID=182803 RepID=A0A4Y2FYB4_ARAVE|nr:hypothetical protein AVEN_56262-1 [Araneus ventricosus]
MDRLNLKKNYKRASPSIRLPSLDLGLNRTSTYGQGINCLLLLLLTNPSDLNRIRTMRSFALITSNAKSGRLSRSSYTKATQSSRCCGVASIMLHFVQILNFISPRENLRVFKCPDDKRAKAVWSFLTPLQQHLGLHNDSINELVDSSKKC